MWSFCTVSMAMVCLPPDHALKSTVKALLPGISTKPPIACEQCEGDQTGQYETPDIFVV